MRNQPLSISSNTHSTQTSTRARLQYHCMPLVLLCSLVFRSWWIGLHMMIRQDFNFCVIGYNSQGFILSTRTIASICPSAIFPSCISMKDVRRTTITTKVYSYITVFMLLMSQGLPVGKLHVRLGVWLLWGAESKESIVINLNSCGGGGGLGLRCRKLAGPYCQHNLPQLWTQIPRSQLETKKPWGGCIWKRIRPCLLARTQEGLEACSGKPLAECIV